MKTSSPPSAPDRLVASDLLQILAAETMMAVPELAATEIGQLVSWSIAFPPGHFPRLMAPGAECQWLAPEGSLYGSGDAMRLEGDIEREFQELGGRWRFLGHGRGRPICFFTYPPPNSMDRPILWVPKVAIGQSVEGLSVTLSLQRGLDPIATAMNEWMALLSSMLTPAVEPDGGGEVLSLTAFPEAALWEDWVRTTSQAIADRRFDKVVLARRFDVALSKPPAVPTLVNRLAEANPRCVTFALPHHQGKVVASTPEILASKRGRQVIAHALAGTAKRHDGEAESRTAADQLLASAKERLEHDVVVTTIAAQLRTVCDAIQLPPGPTIMALRFVQHLLTPIRGDLRAGVGLLELVKHLYPTPAVLGFPREAAALWLESIGDQRDGLYTGVAGWIDSVGDGVAAVVLRSALIRDCRAVLWAGAGIMAESLPQAEFAETELKVATMLEVLRSL
jgi:menaquinone-specific isochorismate synthase